MNDLTLGAQAEPVKRKKRGPNKPKQRGVEGMTSRDIDQGGLSLDPRESAAHESPRPKRVSMQGAEKLGRPDTAKKGYACRWFNDKDGRVQQAIAAYWEPVKSADGKDITRQSGPFMVHCMQLAPEYAEEDRQLKKKKISARLYQEAAVGADEYTTNANGSALNTVESGNPFK
jgi:hypothetical protein